VSEHRGQLYGLVDPIWEQANVLADVLTGLKPEAAYQGSKLGTKLKVMGVELASMGVTKPGRFQ
jgi:nitrite reductase (NADH) large subunit